MKRCCQRQTKCNLFILSVSFLLFHSALDLLQILHYGHKSSEGIASLGVLHGVTVFSCLLVPLLLKTFGLKKTMAISGILLLVYATSSSVPSHQVLLPSAILLGLITAPLWSAQCSYLTTLTYRSIENSKETAEQAVGRSVSLFESTTRTSRIFSGLAATFLLKHSNSTAYHNSTKNPECGATNCNPVSYSLLLPQITDNAQKFITIFSAACVLAGVLLLVSFLDDLKENSCGRCSTREALLDTVRLLMNRRLLLLLPLIVCTGIEQAFIVGDFAKWYAGCILGEEHIGLATISFGLVNCLTAIGLGPVNKHVPRLAVVSAATVFNLLLLIVLLFWRPAADDRAVVYVVAAAFGLCDAIWQTHTKTIFALMFSNEQHAAFANFRLFQTLGFALSFAFSYFLCTRIKVLLLGSSTLFAICLYVIVEIDLQKAEKSQITHISML